MANNKIEKMKQVYAKYPTELKENLSLVRIFEYSDFTRVPKEHKKILKKEFDKVNKTKNLLRSKFLKTITGPERKIVKSSCQDFYYEVEILGYDLENAENLVELSKAQIQRIKSEYDNLKRGKRKEATKELETLRSKVLLYCIAKEKIKFYYDAISKNNKYGLKAIKIRNKIENKQRNKINAIDNKIANLTKVVNATPGKK